MKEEQFGPVVRGKMEHGSSSKRRLFMRLRPTSTFFPVSGVRRSGYTLVEILVAMSLTLILMTAVVTVFGGVGDGIAKSRRALEQFDRMRPAAQQLRVDLAGVTATPDGNPAGRSKIRGIWRLAKAASWAPPKPSTRQRIRLTRPSITPWAWAATAATSAATS